MKRLVVPLLLVSLLLACGCVVKDAGIAGQAREWRVGRTTPREVVAEWGNPDKIQENTWIWKSLRSNGGKFKLGYHGVGITLSNTRTATREYQLEFDENGRLKSSQTVDSVPDGADWSAWPFGD